MTANPTPNTLHGRCHCGRIHYEVDLDLHANATTRCNCTWCRRHGWWATAVAPSAFRLLSEPVETDNSNPFVERVRCPQCHVVVYGTGDQPELGGAFVSLNVRTLEDAPLDGVAVAYLDGLHDTWALLGTATHRERPWLR